MAPAAMRVQTYGGLRNAVTGARTGVTSRVVPGRRPFPEGCAYTIRAAGLTLIEMLVVFVLLGLVSTLLFQGTGFFATRYETVQRLHREGSVTGLQQHWFISTVQALVPYGRETRRFLGNADSFEGVTLQPLAAEPGMPAGAAGSSTSGMACRPWSTGKNGAPM